MKDELRYDLLVQDALRGVVRKVLTNAARDGLPGEHHFFITFKTGAPGVQLSARMRREYPDDITIVLQHQFWDMVVDDSHFEVGLSFKNVPEKLSVPFSAITAFADPSVQFALRFDEGETEPAIADNTAPAPEPAEVQHLKPAPAAAAKPKSRENADADGPASAKPARKPQKKDAAAEDKPEGSGDEGGNVVSIDAFRKKT